MTSPDPLLTAEPGTPVVVLIGDRLTLTGTLTTVTLGDATAVSVALTVPGCTCPTPGRSVDPGCLRCYPEPPEHLVVPVAKAVAASRHWAFRAGMGPHVDGADDLDVNAAEAVLAVLLGPTTHGVFQ